MVELKSKVAEQPAWISSHPHSSQELGDLFVTNSHRTAFLQTPFTRFVHQKLDEGYRTHHIYDLLLSRIDIRTGVKANPNKFPTHALYVGHQLDKLELLGKGKLGREQRLDFVDALMTLYRHSKRVTRQMKNVIGKSLYFLEPGQRRALSQRLLQEASSPFRSSTSARLLGVTLRSSPTARELQGHITALDPNRILAVGRRDLHDLVARCVLMSSVKADFPLPKDPSKYCNRLILRKRITQLEGILQGRIDLIKSYPQLAKTLIGKRYVRICKNDLQCLLEEKRDAKTSGAMRSLIRTFNIRNRLQMRYGILLSNERNSDGRLATRWSEDWLKDVAAVFKQIPESFLLHTPRLNHIKLFAQSIGAYGQRDDTGIIRLYEDILRCDRYSSNFRNTPALRPTVIHEIGHSIKFGKASCGQKHKEDISELVQQSNPLCSFGAFMELSGWRVIPRGQYSVSSSSNEVYLAEYDEHGELASWRPVALNQSQNINGEYLSLTYDKELRTLYAFDVRAEFPVEKAAQDTPWEDWAESFTSYVLAPRLLLHSAPYKFWHLEFQFRKYHRGTQRNNEVYIDLYNSLGRRNALGTE